MSESLSVQYGNARRLIDERANEEMERRILAEPQPLGPRAPTSEQRAQMQAAPPQPRGVTGDITAGLGEAPKQIVGGVRDAVVEFGQTLNDLSDWMETVWPAWQKLNQGKLQVQVPEVGTGETVTGGIVRSVSQFLAGFVPAMKATKAVGITGKMIRPAAAGALTDIAAFDPNSPRLSNLINEMAPTLRTPITEYLAAQPGDTAAEGRLKNALEGLGIGVAADGLVRGLRAIRARKGVEVATQRPPAPPGETIPAQQALGPGRPPLALPERATAPEGPIPQPASSVLGQVGVAGQPVPRADVLRAALKMTPAERKALVEQALAERRQMERVGVRGFRAEAAQLVEGPPAPPSTVLIVDDLGRPVEAPITPTMSERERLRAFERTPMDQPPRAGAVEPQQMAEPAAKGTMPSAADVAMERAGQAIQKELDLLQRSEDLFRAIPGYAEPQLLAQMAAGAIAGGTVGDTPEERITNAFLGMGLGAVAPQLAKAAWRSYKSSGLADESGALDFSKFVKRPRVTAAEQVQPNYARIDAPHDVKALMKNVHRALKEQITEAQRIPTSHDETTRAAHRMIANDEVSIDSILRGDPISIETLPAWSKAARDLNVGVARETIEIAKRVKAGTALPGEIRQAYALQGELHRRVRVMQTRLGQGLEAQKIGARPMAGEAPIVHPERLAQMGDEIAPHMTDDEIADITLRATPAQVTQMANALSVLPRALLEAMYGAMLSGETAFKNFMTAVVMPPVAIGVRGLARYMPTTGAGRVMPGEASAMIHAWYEGVSEQIAMLRHWDLDAIKAQTAREVTFQGERRYAPAITAENFHLSGWSGKAVDWLGLAFRFPLEVLNATDAAAKAVNGRMMLRVEAIRQATKEGLTDDALWRRVDDLITDVTKLDEQARVRIEDFKQTQTFTKDLENRMLSAIQAGPPGDGWGQLLWRNLMVPFFRTPVRIFEAGLELTPGLNFISANVRRDWQAGGVARQIVEAKMAFGGAALGLFGLLEHMNWITGAAPEDPHLRKLWMDAGNQEYSFWTGSRWVSYRGFEPISTIIGVAANTSQLIRNTPGEADKATLFVAAILAQFETFETQRYMMGLSDMLNVLRARGSDSRIEAGLKLVRKRLSSWSPAALAEVESLVDPAIRREVPSGALEDTPVMRELTALWDRYRARIPGFSTAKNADGDYLVPPIRNSITGEAIVDEGAPFLPRAKTYKPDVVFDEVLRLEGAGLNELPQWVGGHAPGPNVGLSEPKASAGVRLSGPTYDRWVVLMTQEVKDDEGHTYYQALKAAMQHPEYAAQSDGKRGGKAAWLQGIERYFREVSEAELLEEYPALKARVLQQQINRAVEKVPTREQATMRGDLQRAVPGGLMR